MNSPEDGPVGPKHVEIRRYINKTETVTSVGFYISYVICVVLVVICLVRLFVLFYVLFVCKCVLPSGDNPTAVNKYINIIIQDHFRLPEDKASYYNRKLCGYQNRYVRFTEYLYRVCLDTRRESSHDSSVVRPIL